MADVKILVLLVAMLASAVATARGAQFAPQSPGEAVGGLQMAISVDQDEGLQTKAPIFRVDLRNTGKTDLILNLGFMLGNGRAQYPDAIVLMLTDVQGKSRQFSLRGPAGVAGRLDALVVPLSVGSTFSIPVDIDRYWAAASKEFNYKLTPGTYSIEAQFTGTNVSRVNSDVTGIALMPFWDGTVRSNSLRFEVPR